ncbi:Thiol-specific monooxygenase [Sphaceloma murrayae]|uniref:Thiol-specific monooxygenase n=1 Tax=Sphaceloma murrayae TaxID=2082308 RepID=A0A2K1QIN4_9PEZI|nr:Thiol-specific monooxygenase [Sphaceloma murrayae]
MQNRTVHHDVVVIGAGIGGLAAAKTYLELAPETDLVLLEARETVGGVWAAENCYDGLKTNNLRGTYEFTDFPMTDKYGIKQGQHIMGTAVHEYLTDFAHHFDLFRRIHFKVRVYEVEKLGLNEWRVLCRDVDALDGEPIYYHTNKLIVCNGLASNPNPVSIPGVADFGKPILHHGQLREQGAALANDPNVDHVTVIGASKTGYDAVYMLAAKGKQVDWVIRESGGGGVWMSPPWVNMGPSKVMLEHLATMRFMSWFSPCIWGDSDGYGWFRALLHGTWLGRLIVHYFWEKIRWDTVSGNGYRKEHVLAPLEPRESLFWSARVGILNYASDIHQFLRTGQVRIIQKDISSLAPKGTIIFADGSTTQTSGLIAITGWKLSPTILYKPIGIDATLGIPSASYSPVESAFWSDLEDEADKHILTKFPYLANPPTAKLPYTQSVTPVRLYRGIAPPGLTTDGDRSLVFMKMVHSTSNFIIAETQALWSFAYLNNKLAIDESTVFQDTARTSRFGKWRYPWGFSAWYPEFVYDAVPYADLLLNDLGLERYRKRNRRDGTGSLKEELFTGYTVHDYKGLNGEWREGNWRIKA